MPKEAKPLTDADVIDLSGLDNDAINEQIEMDAAELDRRLGTPGQEVAEDAPPVAVPTSPAKARVVLGTEVLEVDPSVAEAIRREIDGRAGRYGSELDQMRREIASLREKAAPVAAPTEPEVFPPDPDLLNTASEQYDPRAYHAQNIAYQESLVINAMQALETQRRNEAQAREKRSSQDNEWQSTVNRFFTEVAPELRGYEDVVDSVWKRNAREIAALGDEGGLRRLKELSVQRMTSIAEKGKTLSRTPTLETSRRAPAPAPVAEAEGDSPSVADLIRAKQKAFRSGKSAA